MLREQRRQKEEEEKRRQQEAENKRRREEEDREKRRQGRERMGAVTPSSPSGATTPTAGKPETGTGGGGSGRRASGPKSFRETWRGWWLVNDRALLPARVYRSHAVTTPAPADPTVMGRTRREHTLTQDVLPTLRAVLDPDADSPELMLRGGLLALGKAARTEAAPALLAHWLDADSVAVEVREAAALGIGLLRRSDDTRTLTPEVIDALRQKLIRVVDDDDAPEVVRATCALSIGMLGDQPFGTGIQQDGRLVAAKLWRSLASRKTGSDLSIGLLTALGMQPPAGVTDEMRAQLLDVVKGRAALGRPWNDDERGHALAALVHLEAARSGDTIRMSLTGRRIPLAVRRAGLIALGRAARQWSAGDRLETARSLRLSLRRVHDPLSRGLASIAIGHLLCAQAQAGGTLNADAKALLRHLDSEARNGSTLTRGFAAVALGLAFRDPGATDDEEARSPGAAWTAARKRAVRRLLQGLESGKGDADQLGAYAVALGLMRARTAIPVLTKTVEGRDQPDMLRWDAAVALAQIGTPGPEAVRALNVALFDRHPRVQSGAALGLSLLQGPMAGRRLLRELEHASRTEEIARLTEPLGYLLDPTEAKTVTGFVKNETNTVYARASMLVALGNIADPERRSSLGMLGFHAYYPGVAPTFMGVIQTR